MNTHDDFVIFINKAGFEVSYYSCKDNIKSLCESQKYMIFYFAQRYKAEK
jgi:hypothetical protein